jgi:hypothetical protein
MNFASTSMSIRRRALAAIVGTLVAATLTVGALAAGHSAAGDNLAARKLSKLAGGHAPIGGNKYLR